METEENIVYQILDAVRGGRLNDDELLGERDVRSYLRVHRANIIRKTFKDGYTISDDEFQSLGIVTIAASGSNYIYTLPGLIRLPNNMGLKVTTASGYNIPIITKEDFHLSKANPYNGKLPKGYINNNVLTIYPGHTTTEEVSGFVNPTMMNEGSGFESVRTEIVTDLKVDIDAVLYNPDDDTAYDWTTDPYPLSPELIAILKEQIDLKEFVKIINAKTDEVTNMKADNVRYHDQGKID